VPPRWVIALLVASCAGGPPPNVRIEAGPVPEGVQLHARPDPVFRPARPGFGPLGLSSPRDALLFVPEAARSRRVPLLVMLHGAGGSAARIWDTIRSDAEERGVAVLMPECRGWSWDYHLGDFGEDRRFIDAALAETFRRVPVEGGHVAVGGFSAGATMALSLGTSNGDLFGWVFAFSPTGIVVTGRVGHPRFLVAHGLQDELVPIAFSSRAIVPALRSAGYWVAYRELPGEHEVFPEAVHEAFSLLVGD
jgi:phospholipase/carboxylesterase